MHVYSKRKNKTEKVSCIDFVKLVEVDSRLSIKCTCHQTSAKVKYITLYVHNYMQQMHKHRWMTRQWQHHNNSFLMSKCKHLMDGTVMRNKPSPECWKNDISCVTHECDNKGCGEKWTTNNNNKKEHKHLYELVDGMIKIWHCICPRT